VACYFIGGLGGGFASVWWNAATVSVGASGAIFGLWGALIAIALWQPATLPIARSLLLKVGFALLGFNILLGLLNPGIDNACHVGGFVSGTMAGLLCGVFPSAEGRVRARKRQRA
jgi:rhomboid protease GluP